MTAERSQSNASDSAGQARPSSSVTSTSHTSAQSPKDIHEGIATTAIIHPRAQIDTNVTVGPYSVVGEHVRIGPGAEIGSHVVLDGWTTIGARCKIFTGAVIGSDPQDLKYEGGESYVSIGDDTIIREYCTINRATYPGEETRIGTRCLLMSYAHVAHNCSIQDRVIVASFAALAGHICVEEDAIIGGLVAIHQFVRVGRNAIVGGASGVTKDVLPYCLVTGHPACVYGLNRVGLKRHGFDARTIRGLKEAYRTIFRSGLTEKEALAWLKEHRGECPEPFAQLIRFVETTERGLCRERHI